MKVIPVQTDVIVPPQDDLLHKIQQATFTLQEYDCIVITSKVVSIWQGRCLSKQSVTDKDALIISESEWYVNRDDVPQGAVMHTIKNGYLITSAGIDTNNSNGYYILLPDEPQQTAQQLLEWFKATYHITHLFLVISDSRSVMLRRGAVGCAIAWAGFEPLYYHAGERDVFNHRVGEPYTTNLPDSLATTAVLAMGEVGECTPLAIVRDVSYLQKKNKSRGFAYTLSREDDIFAPFFRHVSWRKGGKN